MLRSRKSNLQWRIVFITANVLIILTGVTISVLAWETMKYKYYPFHEDFQPLVFRICYSIFVFGIVLSVIGLIGVFTAFQPVHWLYRIYKIPLLVTAAFVFLVLGVLCFVVVELVQASELKDMVDMMSRLKVRDEMDDIEFFNNCCGLTDQMELYLGDYPPTCCTFEGYQSDVDFIRESSRTSYTATHVCNEDFSFKQPCDRHYINPFQYILEILAIIMTILALYLLCLTVASTRFGQPVRKEPLVTFETEPSVDMVPNESKTVVATKSSQTTVPRISTVTTKSAHSAVSSKSNATAYSAVTTKSAATADSAVITKSAATADSAVTPISAPSTSYYGTTPTQQVPKAPRRPKVPLLCLASFGAAVLGVLSLTTAELIQVAEREIMIEMMTGQWRKRDDMDTIEFSNECCGVKGKLELYDPVNFPASCCPFKGYRGTDFVRIEWSPVYESRNACTLFLAYTLYCDDIFIHPFQYFLTYLGYGLVLLALLFFGISAVSGLLRESVVKADLGVESLLLLEEIRRTAVPVWRCPSIKFLPLGWIGWLAGSSLSLVVKAEAEEGEPVPPRARPDSLRSLTKATRFTEQELKRIYRGFKAECPSGLVREDTFRSIYSQFFPQGANSSQYATYVFHTLDQANSGTLSFQDLVRGLSVLCRGSVEERLKWTFTLYDINKDGKITRDELADVITSVYNLLGRLSPLHGEEENDPLSSKIDVIFQRLDQNKDGVVTWEEFFEACTSDETITSSMAVFDSAI
ncbi:hypothetical protein GE061_007527 [Apolygus lucorum]|uniref:EF-hand domain-containing protein n=1 Tax=Apolygus lucorum TaxID=248454 RepID=A0A8S9WTQ0_APOLU|nr:hypothetical protein GE061_007527 [Apolygus lucorum]